jgi:hypothetical protein
MNNKTIIIIKNQRNTQTKSERLGKDLFTRYGETKSK